MKFKQCVAVVFSLILATSALSAEIPKLDTKQRAQLRQAEKLIAAGEPRKGAKLLEALRASLGKSRRHPDVDANLAKLYLAVGQTNQALEFIGHWATDRKQYNPKAGTAYLAAANVQRERKQLDAALRIFDWIATNENGKNVVRQARAAEGVGRVYLEQKKYLKASQAFGFGARNLEAHRKTIKRESEAADLSKDALNLLNRLRRLSGDARAKYNHEQFLARVGESYILYRDAESKRLSRKYDAARAAYQKVIDKYGDTVYAEASKFYKAIALIEKKAPKDVIRGEGELKRFIAEKPAHGLYKGQARLILGRAAIERRLDQKLAEQWMMSLDKWLIDIRKRRAAGTDKSNGYEGVKDGAKSLAKPPATELSKPDFWGNVRRNKLRPGQLINRQTADWYLDKLEGDCAKYLVFLYLVRDDKKAAMKNVNRLATLDAEMKANKERGLMWSDYARLKWSAENGYMVAFPVDLKLYNKRQRFIVQLGDFYYITQQFKRSIHTYERLLKDEFGKLSSAQKDYPYYALGSVRYRDRQGADAALREHFKVMKERDGTLSETRAALAIGNMARSSKDIEITKRGWVILQALARQKPTNEFICKARVRLGRDFLKLGREKDGLAMLESVPKKSTERGLAEWFINKHEEMKEKN